MQELITKKDYEIAEESVKIDNNLEKCFKNVVDNYLRIGYLLKEFKKNNMFECYGFKNIYEYSNNRFKLSETSTKNFINIYNRFADHNHNYDWNISLKDDYKKYSYSQLVELLSVSENKLLEYNPEMSVKEIRFNKKLDKYNNDLIEELKKLYYNVIQNASLLTTDMDGNLIINLKTIDTSFNDFKKSDGEFFISIPYELMILEGFKTFNGMYSYIDLIIKLDEKGIKKIIKSDYRFYLNVDDVQRLVDKRYDLSEYDIVDVFKEIQFLLLQFVEQITNSKKLVEMSEKKDEEKRFYKDLMSKQFTNLKEVENIKGVTINYTIKLLYKLLSSNSNNVFLEYEKVHNFYIRFDNITIYSSSSWSIDIKEWNSKVSISLYLREIIDYLVINKCNFSVDTFKEYIMKKINDKIKKTKDLEQ